MHTVSLPHSWGVFTFCYRSLKEACPLSSQKTLSHCSGLLATNTILRNGLCNQQDLILWVYPANNVGARKTQRRNLPSSFYYSEASKDVHVYCKTSNFPKNVEIMFSIRKFYMFFAWRFKYSLCQQTPWKIIIDSWSSFEGIVESFAKKRKDRWMD